MLTDTLVTETIHGSMQLTSVHNVDESDSPSNYLLNHTCSLVHTEFLMYIVSCHCFWKHSAIISNLKWSNTSINPNAYLYI